MWGGNSNSQSFDWRYIPITANYVRFDEILAKLRIDKEAYIEFSTYHCYYCSSLFLYLYITSTLLSKLMGVDMIIVQIVEILVTVLNKAVCLNQN